MEQQHKDKLASIFANPNITLQRRLEAAHALALVEIAEAIKTRSDAESIYDALRRG